MTDEASNEPTIGTLDGSETQPTEAEVVTKHYTTSSGKSVAIREFDPNYKPTDLWLEHQARTAATGGAFGSEINSARIAELVDEIRKFDYDRYKTPIKYAAKWGISARYVRNLCSQAIKVVREEVTDEDYVTTTVCEALDKVIRDNIKNPRVGNQKLVVQAAKVWAEIAGVRAPVELRLSRGRDADGLPDDPEQLRAIAARLLGQHITVEVVDEKKVSDYPGANPEALEAAEREMPE